MIHILVKQWRSILMAPYQDLMNRISSFGTFSFIDGIDNFPTPVKTLFNSEKFQTAAKSVCPKDKPFIVPFQYNYILQVPGQTFSFHLDSPSFWGATRFDFPQWFIVSMVFSGLFQDKFINQIQVVGYLHEWTNTSIGGEFIYYENETTIHAVQPVPRSGTLVDGTKVLHAARVYRPDVKPPVMNKDKRCALLYSGDEKWRVECSGEVLREYVTNDLRTSIVYRARCFQDEEEMLRFKNQSPEDAMSLEHILSTLSADMVTRGVVSSEKLSALTRLDLAMLIMDTYVKYPLPPVEQAWIPFNYCALPMQLPWTLPFFKLIC